MLAALHDPSAAVRQAAIVWVAHKWASTAPVREAAASYLAPGQPAQVREDAALILGSGLIPGSEKAAADRFAPLLVPLLLDKNSDVNDAAFHSLHQMGAAAVVVVPRLVVLLKDTSAGVRYDAVTLLGDMGAAGPFAPQIAAMLRDPAGDVRAGAATTLGELGPQGAPYAGQIFPLLKEEGYISVEASKALCHMPQAARPLIPNLIPLLKDPVPDVREAVAYDLANLTCLGGVVTDAAPALVPLLGDDNARVRRAATHVLLNELWPAAAPYTPQLTALAGDPDSEVRMFVRAWLLRLGQGPAAAAVAPHLVPLLKSPNSASPGQRCHSAWAHGSRRPARLFRRWRSC